MCVYDAASSVWLPGRGVVGILEVPSHFSVCCADARARHCTSLIYSGSRPNQYMQGILVRAVVGARYFDSQASAFLRWPSRPPSRFLSRCHNSDRNFNRLKMRLELHDCLQINTHCDVTLILPPTFKRMHYMRLKLDTRLTNSL